MENQKHFGDNLVSAIKKAATELEEFQVQMSLGKAEAADKVNEVKSKFKSIIHEAKNKINSGDEKLKEVQGKLEHLELQLALGKAEAKDAFEEQKKKIKNTIYDIENFFNRLG